MGFAAAVLLLLAAPLVQADVTWNVASGDWSSADNWSGAAVPTSGDNADIYNGGTATVTQNGEVCNSLSLGGTGGGTLQVTGGSLSISSSALVGVSGSGVFVQSGGAVSLSNASSGAIYFGYNSGDVGTGNRQRRPLDGRQRVDRLPGRGELHPNRRNQFRPQPTRPRLEHRVAGKLQPQQFRRVVGGE